MEIISKRLDEIKPYKQNPRINDEAVEYVASSINEFGFKVPIIIDKNNEIIAGHTRYEASKLLNLEEVPCIIIDDLTEKQIKAFRIADNKVAERSEWDWDKLAEELTDIKFIDMEEYGFENIISGDMLDNFDLSYVADYKIYVKSTDTNEIELAKRIVGEFNEDN